MYERLFEARPDLRRLFPADLASQREKLLQAMRLSFESLGDHATLVAFAVGVSLVGVVLLGTLSGSMLPFVLRRLGLDPASASAPFVATLVDVSGVVIYFLVALLFLRGTLL